MKAPRLIVMRAHDSPKWKAYKQHLTLCETCRDAITEIDLCLEGLALWLDTEGIKAIVELSDRLKS